MGASLRLRGVRAVDQDASVRCLPSVTVRGRAHPQEPSGWRASVALHTALRGVPPRAAHDRSRDVRQASWARHREPSALPLEAVDRLDAKRGIEYSMVHGKTRTTAHHDRQSMLPMPPRGRGEGREKPLWPVLPAAAATQRAAVQRPRLHTAPARRRALHHALQGAAPGEEKVAPRSFLVDSAERSR